MSDINRVFYSFMQQSSAHKLVLSTTLIPIFLWLLAWAGLQYVVPSFPSLTKDLHSTQRVLTLSIIIFYAFFAAFQPVWGFISEYWGRRKVILVSLIISLIGTATIIFSVDMTMYIIGRTLEGVGLASLSPACRAIYVDIFRDRVELGRRVGLVSGIVALMPGISPLIAGYILYAGWRYIFVVFFILTALLFIGSLWKLKETHCGKSPFTPLKLLLYHVTIIRNFKFIAFASCYLLLTGGLLAFYAATPFWFVFHFHVSASVFSYFSLIVAAFYILPLLLTRRLLKKVSFYRVYAIGIAICIAMMLLIFLCVSLWSASIAMLVIVASIYAVTAGFMTPLNNAGAMIIFPEAAGVASAVLTLFVFGGSALLSWITMGINPHRLWLVLLFFNTTIALSIVVSMVFILIPEFVKKQRVNN